MEVPWVNIVYEFAASLNISMRENRVAYEYALGPVDLERTN
jgi:hypothetical protein